MAAAHRTGRLTGGDAAEPGSEHSSRRVESELIDAVDDSPGELANPRGEVDLLNSRLCRGADWLPTAQAATNGAARERLEGELGSRRGQHSDAARMGTRKHSPTPSGAEDHPDRVVTDTSL